MSQGHVEEPAAALAALLDSSPDCILEVDADLRLVYANAPARRLSLEETEVAGRPLTEALQTDFGRSLEALCAGVRDSGEPAVADLLHPVKGTPLSIRAFPCRHGVALFMRSLGPDDPPSAEARRQEAEAQLGALFNTRHAGFSFFDRDLRFVRVNDRLAEINGVPAADHIGRTKEEILPTLVDTLRPVIDRVFATGEALPLMEIQGEMPHEPGARRDWLVGFFPVVIGGTVEYVGCVVTEVTELRDAQREREHLAEVLERERRLLRTAIEHLPAGIVVVQGADGAIILHNTEAERLLGHALDGRLQARVARGDFGGLHPDGAPYSAEDYPLFQSLHHGATIHGAEIRYRRGDGMVTTFSVNSAPIHNGSGDTALAVATFHDISHRKAMEDALRRAKEEAERADLAKSRFLAAASHDLRQPIQSLFLFAESLRGHLDGPAAEAKLLNLQRGLDALKGLLDSLLDVSRLDANMVEPQIELFDLDGLFDEIETAYASIAADQGLTLTVARGCGAVRSDRTLLGRILRNLVENALRYTPAGGITVDCRQGDGQRVRITVTDTGIGIPPEHIHRIWEEFHQVGNPERARERGLGLGLAIVRRLSGLLGHAVTVESVDGRGSTFVVEVPGAAPEETAGAEPAAPPAARHPAAAAAPTPECEASRVALVVDDDAIVLMGMETLLEDWGFTVVSATSGDEALARLESEGCTPDLVIADYRLRAGEVGTATVRRIFDRCGPLPAVILTGETSTDCQLEVTALGLGLAHKPVTPRQLRDAIERQMARHQVP